MKKVAVHTLGCRSNQLESSIIADKLTEHGFQVVKFSDAADIYVINTCTVTSKSDSTSRYFIRKAKSINNKAKIIVTGCYAQTSAEEISQIEGVDVVLGNSEKDDIVETILNIKNANKINVSDIMKEEKFRDKTVLSASGRARATIKVQDGCNFRCSYCIVPIARGKSRSNSLDNIINQVKAISSNGFKEIILSGIHLGQWGLDLKPKTSLAKLLQELEKIETLKRYRLSSIDPMEFDEMLIETITRSKKFCRHLHISLQSGSDKILKAMRRRYNVAQYTELINKLVENIPLINIGSDIIVGFPGETNEDFAETCKNLESLPIGYLHVFSYSKRKSTPAETLPEQVKENIKKQRNSRLRELAHKKKQEYSKKIDGEEFEAIVENIRDKKTGLLKGMTDNYVSVLIDGPDSLKGEIVKIRINSLEDAAQILKN